MISNNEKFDANESQEYDNHSIVKYAVQKLIARDFNHSHCLFIQLFVHRVMNFFFCVVNFFPIPLRAAALQKDKL